MIYVGIDGGGTKTKLTMYKNDTHLATVSVGPSSLNKENIDESSNNINQGLDRLCFKANNKELIDAIFLGLTGDPTTENIELLTSSISNPNISNKTIIKIDNDISNAFAAACDGKPSIGLIIGTGSVGYGLDESGNTHRVSGVHFLEGDLGSGYHIGRLSLQTLSKAIDGRVPASGFTEYLRVKYNVNNYIELAKLFRDIIPNRTETASLAKIAYRFLETNDANAINIFDYAAECIREIVVAVDKKLSLQNREIGIIGGLGQADKYFQLIKDKILGYDNSFNIHKAIHDPVYGSIILARKL